VGRGSGDLLILAETIRGGGALAATKSEPMIGWRPRNFHHRRVARGRFPRVAIPSFHATKKSVLNFFSR
jgi:hypothetical protein